MRIGDWSSDVCSSDLAESEPADAEGLAAYQPVLNVASHYRWEIGLAAPGGRYADGDTRFGFVIAPQASDAKRSGRIVPPDFWAGSAAPECTASGFRYASVPGNAKPETVDRKSTRLNSSH